MTQIKTEIVGSIVVLRGLVVKTFHFDICFVNKEDSLKLVYVNRAVFSLFRCIAGSAQSVYQTKNVV